MDKLEIYFEGRIGRMLGEYKVKGMEIKICFEQLTIC